jgi:queuine tRNA-ribosyltransferase
MITNSIPTATGNLLEILSPQDLQNAKIKTIALNLLPLWARPSAEVIDNIPSLNKWISTAQQTIPINGLQWFYQNEIAAKIKENTLVYRSPFDGREIKITPQEFIKFQIKWQFAYAVTLSCPFYALKNVNAVKLFKSWIDNALQAAQTNQQKLLIELPCLPEAQLSEIIASYENEPLIHGIVFFLEDKEDTFLIDQQIINSLSIPAHWQVSINTNLKYDLLSKIPKVQSLITETPYNDAKQGAFYHQGQKVSLKETRFIADTQPLDLACSCDTCVNYTRSYLHHLLEAKEVFAWRLIAVHNWQNFGMIF